MIRSILIVFTLLWVFPAYGDEIPINAGDVLKISVYNNPDLTTETRVSSNGTISFPLIGEVDISGLSPRNAENKISSKLIGGGFLRKAQVNVIVIDSKSQQVSVLGYVRMPGKYSVDASAKNIIDFVSLAGGKTPEASDKVIVIKKATTVPERFELDLDALLEKGDLSVLASEELNLRAGDILYVPKQPLFYIYGEVNRPGAYSLRDKMSVAQALSLGGGVSTRGSESGLVIKRKDSLGNLQELDVDTAAEVKENDVVYVRESIF